MGFESDIRGFTVYAIMYGPCVLENKRSNCTMYILCTEYLNRALTIVSVKYERIKFLVLALRDSIEIYAWAPKPYHKFMAFKVEATPHFFSSGLMNFMSLIYIFELDTLVYYQLWL